MSRIQGKDSKPEMAVRRLVHGMGYRYRLHDRKLAGKPDLVFKSKGKVLFVHGCFWHRHPKCALARLPKSRLDFWKPKLEGNRKRDLRNLNRLKKDGWDVMVVWECEITDITELSQRIRNFLEEPYS